MHRTPSVIPLPSTIHAEDGTVTVPAGAIVRIDSGESGRDDAANAVLAAETHAEGSAPRSEILVPATVGDGARDSEGVSAEESYRIAITTDGIRIEAADDAGLFYAAQTLRRLLDDGEASPGGIVLSAVTIEDAPRFVHRGLSVDIARHFFGVDVLKRVIDQAAALKLNRLHLHLTDDQGWRLALSSRPDLAGDRTGAGGHLTRADYRELIEYAAARHMVVIPEIDLPGHTHAAGVAYPEVAEPPALTHDMRTEAAGRAEPLPKPGAPYAGMLVGFSSLRIGSPEARAFVTDVLTEVAAITPGPYLHIGGDEALGTPPDAYAQFVAEVTAQVFALGKTPIGWHEIGAAPALAPGTIGQYWGFTDSVDERAERARAIVERGGKIILSPADAIYLDMKYAEDDPIGLTWANGATSVERSYAWEPANVLDIPEEAILGVEAAVWTETILTEEQLQSMLYPRLAAAAEAAWSAAAGTNPARSWDSFRSRLDVLALQWEHADIAHGPLDPA